MHIDENDMRPIWLNDKDESVVDIIDQRLLPHEYVIKKLRTVDETITAIKDMSVRGAPLIGATGAYGVYLATLNCPSKEITEKYLRKECERLKASRPTAVNLAWAVDLVLEQILKESDSCDKIKTAKKMAEKVTEGEALNSKKIGEFGVSLIEKISQAKNGETVNILTHCNAGWLACIGYGTATAPIYEAFNRGIDVHVWVDETRPLNQGSRLTAWELGKYGVKHTIITDNAGGHLMQHKMVDIVITGTDRTTYTGDVANKIGTYLKALAAHDNNIPFYVALPSSTFDWTIKDGVKDIPIEIRDPDEIRYIQGSINNKIENVLVPPIDSPAGNYAFDVTPARLVTGFITERGLCKASEKSILELFPEKKQGEKNA